MSLKPTPNDPVPEISVGSRSFPEWKPYVRLRDELGTIFKDDDFADLFQRRGKPALTRWRPALVTVLQVRESLRSASG